VKQDPAETDFKTLTTANLNDYNAMNEITQTNFTISLQLPNIVSTGVLRVRYVSNNPLENDRGTIFYACSNVQLVKAKPQHTVIYNKHHNKDSSILSTAPYFEADPAKPKDLDSLPRDVSHSCCAPPIFTTEFTHVINSTHYKGVGKIYYNNNTQQMRVDVVTGSGKQGTTNDGNFQMYMNFTNGIEYYYNAISNSCDAYGLDFWNEYCFGTAQPGESEVFVNTGTCYSYNNYQQCNAYKNGAFVFTANTDSCAPISLIRTERSPVDELTLFGNTQFPQSIDNSVFVPPAACQKLKLWGKSRKEIAETLRERPNQLALAAISGHLRNFHHLQH
jgi:hypothetical protein